VSDPSGHSISIFAAGDQLLKGAALNAVQIAEALLV
jgi:aspartate-semialdehyde dehydrogenase